MKYISYEEVRKAELTIGERLLQLDEETIDYIKFSYITGYNNWLEDDLVGNFMWDLHYCPILGTYWEYDDMLSMSSNVVEAFLKRLRKEKYYKRGRREILNTANKDWQRHYRIWKKKIFERDRYTCKKCGSNKHLHAHHIKHRSKYPELEFDLDNGITLCKECHAEEHQYINKELFR
jgi:hypothetical protein